MGSGKRVGLLLAGISSTLLLGCRDYSWRPEAEKMKVDADRILIPSDAPIYMDEFKSLLADYAPIKPSLAYFHILNKLSSMSDKDIASSTANGFSWVRCTTEPAEYRGKFFIVRGTIANIEPFPLAGTASTVQEIHQGVLYMKDYSPVIFHVIDKPDPLYLGEDSVQLEGIFINLMRQKTVSGEISVPFFMAKRLKRYS